MPKFINLRADGTATADLLYDDGIIATLSNSVALTTQSDSLKKWQHGTTKDGQEGFQDERHHIDVEIEAPMSTR